MDAKGRAELGEVLMHHSGLAPPLAGADLTSLQVQPSFSCVMTVCDMVMVDALLFVPFAHAVSCCPSSTNASCRMLISGTFVMSEYVGSEEDLPDKDCLAPRCLGAC